MSLWLLSITTAGLIRLVNNRIYDHVLPKGDEAPRKLATATSKNCCEPQLRMWNLSEQRQHRKLQHNETTNSNWEIWSCHRSVAKQFSSFSCSNLFISYSDGEKGSLTVLLIFVSVQLTEQEPGTYDKCHPDYPSIGKDFSDTRKYVIT
jgi:hypothetical protein